MPIIKSAKKKMRQDRKRRSVNLKTLTSLKKALADARKKPSVDSLKKASSIIDQGVKKGIIHKNKASRLKSRLAKKLVSKPKSSSVSLKKNPKKRS